VSTDPKREAAGVLEVFKERAVQAKGNPDLYKHCEKVWGVRKQRRMVMELPPQYAFFLCCCYEAECCHPLCKEKLEELPRWSHNRLSTPQHNRQEKLDMFSCLVLSSFGLTRITQSMADMKAVCKHQKRRV